jgi:hypothetical protein
MTDDNSNDFDVLYEQLFGGDEPVVVAVPAPARVLNALSTATCQRCRSAMKNSMVGFVHVKSGNDLCYGIHRPNDTGIPVVDE